MFIKIYRFILNLLAPKKCYSCKKEGRFLCDNCYNLERDFEEVCYICKNFSKNYEIHDKCKNNIYFDKVIILKHYKGYNLSKIIKQAKFYNKKEIFEELSFYMYEKFITNQKIRKLTDFIIIPVPSFYTTKLLRGYNQSEILAKNISNISKIKYSNNLVFKVKKTRQQSTLKRQQRIINVKNSFTVAKNKTDKLDKKNIILIDDVISTGSTVNEISRILKQNNVKNIVVLIIASD